VGGAGLQEPTRFGGGEGFVGSPSKPIGAFPLKHIGGCAAPRGGVIVGMRWKRMRRQLQGQRVLRHRNVAAIGAPPMRPTAERPP
jgi:hypothetical protein